MLNNCKAGMYGAAISAVSAGPTELNVDGLFSLEGSSLATVAKRRSIYKVNKPDSFLSDSISALDTYPDRTIVSRGLGLLLLSSWAAALETT